MSRRQSQPQVMRGPKMSMWEAIKVYAYTKARHKLILVIAGWLPVNIADEAIPILGQADDIFAPVNLAAAGWVFFRAYHIRNGHR